MADISKFTNNILNIKEINKVDGICKLPFNPNIYGNINYNGYTKNSASSILNEPKLLIAPYNTIILTNNQFEGFKSDLDYLRHTSNVLVSQNLDLFYKSKIWFDNYKLGDSEAKYHHVINESIDELPLITNAYANYIQNNKTQAAFFNADIAVGAISNIISTVGAAASTLATGGVGAAIGIAGGNLVNNSISIGKRIMKRQDLKTRPDNVRNIGNNLLYDYINDNIKLFTYNLKPQNYYLNRAWQYLFRYGYRCDEFKIPNLRSRYYFNFIQTTDANLKGNLPVEYLNKIKSIYNNGITLWHYRSDNVDPDIGNYERENAEVSIK